MHLYSLHTHFTGQICNCSCLLIVHCIQGKQRSSLIPTHWRNSMFIITPSCEEILAASRSLRGIYVCWQVTKWNFLSTVTMLCLASIKAKGIPTQFRDPAPNGIHAMSWRWGTCSDRNLEVYETCNYSHSIYLWLNVSYLHTYALYDNYEIVITLSLQYLVLVVMQSWSLCGWTFQHS